MTPQTSIAAFVGISVIAGLAFYLAWTLRGRKIREVKSFNELLDHWLTESRKVSAEWQARYDNEKSAHELDQRQFASMVETLRERELRTLLGLPRILQKHQALLY